MLTNEVVAAQVGEKRSVEGRERYTEGRGKRITVRHERFEARVALVELKEMRKKKGGMKTKNSQQMTQSLTPHLSSRTEFDLSAEMALTLWTINSLASFKKKV